MIAPASDAPRSGAFCSNATTCRTSRYAASIVTHGQGAEHRLRELRRFHGNSGFTGCHSSVPSLQKLAVYAAEALEELEAALLPKPARKAVAAKAKRRRSAAAA